MTAKTLAAKLFLYSLALPRTLRGLFAFHSGPRKKIVIIASAMRAGSTLLKALLAEAPDVSNLPEIDFGAYAWNRFHFYGAVSSRSPRPILVLKQPRFYTDYHAYPRLPSGLDICVIALVRHPLSVVQSIMGMEKAARHRKPPIHFDEPALLDYWFETYEKMAAVLEQLDYPVKVLHYEDLVAQPERLTRDLFTFIGSSRTQGVMQYHKPGSFEWVWGKDDGGEKIQSLRVLRGDAKMTEVLDARLQALGLDARYARVIQRLKAAAAVSGNRSRAPQMAIACGQKGWIRAVPANSRG